MEPVAYGFLALMPWQWEELLERATVAEIERVIYGARWRESVVMDRLAWQTAFLLSAAGSKPAKPGDAPPVNPDDVWSAEKLLGREPLPIDPDASTAVAEEPVDPAEQERGMRAWMAQAEAQIRMSRIRIEGDPTLTPPEPS